MARSPYQSIQRDFQATPTPVLPLQQPDNRTWLDAMGDAVALQPIWQAVGRSQDATYYDEAGFSPFDGNYLDGYDAYVEDFIGISNRVEADRLKQRIDRNLERRANVDANLGFWSLALSEVINPTNLIPLPGVMGAGFLKGVLRAGTGFAGVLTAEEMLRQGVDPTATTEESIDNVLYGTLFGGLLGGGIGMIGAKGSQRLAREYADFWNTVEREGDAVGMAIEPPPVIELAGQFQARPTGDTATGLAPAYGLEKMAGMSRLGKLAQSGVRAVEDFVNAALGDFGTATARNAQGIKSQNSAFLASQLWNGMAADAMQALERAYVRYLTDGGSGGATAVGLNLRKMTSGISRPAGKMRFDEFQDAVFRAHKSDRIETDNPFVREGVEAVRGFFDRANVEGVKTGAIRSGEGFKRLVASRAKIARQNIARFEELSTKAERTTGETIELMELAAQQQKLLDWFDKRLDLEMADEPELADILDAIDKRAADQAERTRQTRDDIVAKGEAKRDAAVELLASIQRSIEARQAKDRATLDYLNRAFEERGLTARQQALREELAARLDAVPDGDRAGRIFIEYAPPEVDGIQIVYGDTGKPAAAYFNRETGTIHFDLSRVLAQWDAKPWRAPRLEGIVPLTDEMFPTPEAWAEFVLRHELAHTRVERFRAKAGQEAKFTKADYENAMNRIALEEMRYLFELPPVEKFGTAKQLATMRKLEQQLAEGDFLSFKQRAYLDGLEKRLAGQADAYGGPKNEGFYLPRAWDIDKVMADEAGPQQLRATLFQWFKQNPLPGAAISDEAIARRVDDAVKSIIREAGMGDMQVGGSFAGGQHMRSRQIDIPNELVVDFIDTDVSRVMRGYAHSFGVANEMARMFGTVDAEDAIDATVLQYIREAGFDDPATAMSQVEALRNDLEWARDTATGAIYSNDPTMMNQRRLAGFLRSWGTTTMLGGAAISSLTDAVRAIMVNGAGRTFSFLLDGVLANKAAADAVSAELRALTGEGAEMILHGTSSRMVNQGGPVGAQPGMLARGADKFNHFAHDTFFKLNLLGPMTDFLKRWNLTFINQFLLDDIHQLAAGKGGGGLAERLASYGISAEDAAKITAMPLQKNGNIWMPNLSEWADDDLARTYLGAVQGLSRRIVPTPSPLDLPDIARGFVKGREFPLLTMPFQFMSFGFASQNKILVSALQGRDQSAMMGAAMMLGMGYVVSWLKTPDYAWENMSAEERVIDAVDRSGLTGVASNYAGMVNAATMGRVGVRPMLGIESPYPPETAGEAVANTMGPVPSKAYDLTKVLIDGDASDREVASAVRRSIPLNNLFYWKDMWKDLERSAFEDEQ